MLRFIIVFSATTSYAVEALSGTKYHGLYSGATTSFAITKYNSEESASGAIRIRGD
jgi:hypothetical protein